MSGTSLIRRTSLVAIGALALILNTVSPAMAADTHEVNPGDTLYTIAQRYGVTVERIVQVNGIQNPNLIYAGQTVSLGNADPQTVDSQPEQSAPVSDAYTVQSGDTMWSIASKFGITVAQLVEANRDAIQDQNLIHPGQQLDIPGGAGGSVSGADTPAPQAVSPAEETTDQPAQPVSDNVESILHETALAYGLDPALVKAVAWQESGWNQGSVSSSGALGIMQVMPTTGGWISQSLVGRQLDIAGNASENVLAGVVYLEWLIRYTGSEEQALAAYYQGPGSVGQRGWYDDTHHYVDQVKAIRAHLQQHGVPPR